MYWLLHDTTRYVYTVAAVTLFHTTVERASCKVHRLLCICWFPTTLLSVVLVVAVLLDFAAWDELFTGTPSKQIVGRGTGHLTEVELRVG